MKSKRSSLKRDDNHTPAQLRRIAANAYRELTPAQQRKADAAIRAANAAEQERATSEARFGRAADRWEHAFRRMAVALHLPSDFFI